MEEITECNGSNVRAASYYIAWAEAKCGGCGSMSTLAGLALPDGHEALDPESSDGKWQAVDASASIFFVSYVPPSVQEKLRNLAPQYRLSDSEEDLTSYWTNHCKHCGLPFSDHELHCEPGGPFAPADEEEAAAIRLEVISESFDAIAAGYELQPAFFDHLRKA